MSAVGFRVGKGQTIRTAFLFYFFTVTVTLKGEMKTLEGTKVEYVYHKVHHPSTKSLHVIYLSNSGVVLIIFCHRLALVY
jgi:hypothetical protein